MKTLFFLVLLVLALTGGGGSPVRAEDFAARWGQIRQGATSAQLYAFLYDLPKGGDLHHHAGGAGWPEDWLAIGTDPARNGNNRFYTRVSLAHYDPASAVVPIIYQTIQQSAYDRLAPDQRADYVALAELSDRDRAEWLSGMRLDRPGEGRDEFFENIWPRLGALLHDPHVSAELMVVNLRRFGAEGVRYLEPQASLFGQLDHEGRPVDYETVTRIYEERLGREDARATGVESRFQHTILRFRPTAEEDVEKTYRFIDQHRARWVGVNFAGREDRQKGHPRRFLETLRRMRRQYSDIGLSIHAGETDEPDRHVRDTLLLGATRIGHGVNLINDPDTMLLMRGGQFLVEINLISNRLLEYTPDLSKHPFPEYLRFGIPVCLNTDDRGMWGSDMTDEYYTAVTQFRLTWPEIVSLGRNSLAYAFAEPALKERLLKDYERRVADFERKYAAGDDWIAALPREVVRTWYAEHNFGLK